MLNTSSVLYQEATGSVFLLVSTSASVDSGVRWEWELRASLGFFVACAQAFRGTQPSRSQEPAVIRNAAMDNSLALLLAYFRRILFRVFSEAFGQLWFTGIQ